MKVRLTQNDCDIRKNCKNQNNLKHFIRFNRNEMTSSKTNASILYRIYFHICLCIFKQCLQAPWCIYLSNKMKLD